MTANYLISLPRLFYQVYKTGENQMSKLSNEDINNGRVSAKSVTQIIGGEIVSSWLPTICGFPIGKGGEPVKLETRQAAIDYAKNAKIKMLETP